MVIAFDEKIFLKLLRFGIISYVYMYFVHKNYYTITPSSVV